MFTSPPRDGYRGPGISPSYYEDDPIVLASMGDERIKEAKNLPRCSIPHTYYFTPVNLKACGESPW